MEEGTKRRLVGATILVSVFVIVTPMLLDRSGTERSQIREAPLPPAPSGTFPGRLPEISQPPPELASPAEEGLLAPAPFEEPEPGVQAEAALEAQAPSGPQGPEQGPEPTPASGSGLGPSAAPPSGSAPESVAPSVAAAVPGDARLGLTAWAVQLSTFANAANAIALRDALRGRGFVAFVESTPERATRVYVGPELQREKAIAAQQRLARELGIKGSVVSYPGGPAP